MPVHRHQRTQNQPLRARCDIKLRIRTDLIEPTLEEIAVNGDSNLKGPSPAPEVTEFPTTIPAKRPHTTQNVGGRKKRVRTRIQTIWATKSLRTRAPVSLSPRPRVHPRPSLPPPARTPVIRTLSCLLQVSPHISVAFSNGTYDPCSLMPPHLAETGQAAPFTHIVRIVYPGMRIGLECSCIDEGDEALKLEEGMVRVDFDERSGVRVLTLVVPAPESQMRGAYYSRNPLHEKQTTLTNYQLKLARDFIWRALSYSHTAPTYGVSTDISHILITTPPSLPDSFSLPSLPWADPRWSPRSTHSPSASNAISIVSCYLAYAYGEEIPRVFSRLEEELLLAHRDCWQSRGRHALQIENIWRWMGHTEKAGWYALQAVARDVHDTT
ncbi:hypothetical protein BDZ97DRAFT_1871459 [Flammula alnicola]|nr:hypothetical protein BDZ97DRAFT_1871459 [Flammula alnicola]